MSGKVSILINIKNEERNIAEVVESSDWADEIVVVDDGSTDRTLEILAGIKEDKLKIFKRKSNGYVEPARNFAISKASNEWILVLDADEEMPQTLVERLQEIADRMEQIDYVRMPRKNLIFGRWMRYSGWWPDYNIRFFKKGKVKWGDKIHRPPQVSGQGLDLPAEEKYAIVHHSYEAISQFLGRMDRYTGIEAEELIREGYKFDWRDLFEKPLSEFLSRFFASQGYKDGLHGLALSFLQAFSLMSVYLKLWEINKFKEQEIGLTELENQLDKGAESINYWMGRQENFFKRIFKKIKS